jgi:molybdopterin/thiamine biosynthesis adenylyltransferase
VKLPLVLLSEQTAQQIAASGARWGILSYAIDRRDHVYSVLNWSVEKKVSRPAKGGWREVPASRSLRGSDGQALWYRGTAELHERARADAIRGQATPVSVLKDQVQGDWLTFKNAILLITFYSEGEVNEWAAWRRQGEESFIPVDLEIFDPDADLLAPLDVAWPRQEIAEKLVTVIGLGSIGGAACEALAAYGFANFALVDHDRLEAHNFARHRVTRGAHGTYKADAVKDLLESRGLHGLEVEPIVADVGADADLVRPLIQESALVTCFADGPEARQVAAHLAFWAGRPVILACVLGYGAYGEVLRLVPGRTGCLECNRAALVPSLNLEMELETAEFRERLQRPWGSGHVGMSRGLGHYAVQAPGVSTTAVPGDLHLVGGLAAKAAAATLLERGGYREQRLAGDHGVIGLRPPIEEVLPPFDRADRVGKIAWSQTAPPRECCTTCGPGRTT